VELETLLPQLHKEIVELETLLPQLHKDNVPMFPHCPELEDKRLFLRLQILLRQNA
jgi:hypothetical protein